MHRPRFVAVVRQLDPRAAELPAGVVMLSPARRLLWAVAIGLRNLDAIERGLDVQDDGAAA